jgi:8-oxo-dGTP pyrophosphatase MutT (NUDIX family)
VATESSKHRGYAPREVFDQILEWAVIPTFDLVVEVGDQVVIVRRKIAPYRNVWALPGLRMLKGESIDDCLARIARQELGIEVDLANKAMLGQYVGRFATEHQRQDLSTGYAVRALSFDITPNPEHFSGIRLVGSLDELPTASGAMYRHYLSRYWANDHRLQR